MRAYYTKTDEKNSVSLLVPIKKHNKNQVIESVKSQLMYFKENISAFDIYPDYKSEIQFKSKILFENDDLILSDNNYFNRPHFVLKGVNYGLVDFKELELDPRFGNIGFKVDMSEVDVTPSRESIMYTPKTRKTVLEKYDKISKSVAKMVEEKLKDDSLLSWTRSASNILYNTGNSGDDVFKKLSSLIDKSSIDLMFKKDDFKVKLNSNINTYFTNYLKAEHMYLETNWNKSRIKRLPEDKTSSLTRVVLFQTGESNSLVSNYIVRKKWDQVTILKPNFGVPEVNDEFKLWFKGDKEAKKTEDLKKYILKTLEDDYLKGKNDLDDKAMEIVKKSIARDVDKLFNVSNLLKIDMKAGLMYDYNEIQVPSDFKYNGDEEEEDGSDVDYSAQTKEEYRKTLAKRKSLNRFIVSIPYDSGVWQKEIKFTRVEESYSTLPDGEKIYGFSEEAEKIKDLAVFLKKIHKVKSSDNYCSYNDQFVVVQIAKNNKKYFDNDTFVDDFGLIIDKDRKLTTNEKIKKGLIYITFYNLVMNKGSRKFGIIETFAKEFYPDLAIYLKEIEDYNLFSYTQISDLKIKGLDTVLNAYSIQLAKYLNPKMDDEELDKMMVDKLGMDLTDDIKGIDLIPVEDYNKIILLKDIVDAFYNYMDSVQFDKREGIEMVSMFIKNNKHLLKLEHEGLFV